MTDYTGAVVSWHDRRGYVLKALPHADDQTLWCLTAFQNETRWISLSSFDLITLNDEGYAAMQSSFKSVDVRALLEQPTSVRYLTFEFFEPNKTAFPSYLQCQNPVDAAYSVYICARCFAPLPTHRDLRSHETFCARNEMSGYPGVAVYRDDERGITVRFVDGAEHVQFCRNLAVLGAAFVDKDLTVDVDVTEFFVITAPLSSFMTLPRDGRHQDRDVVAGYFARYKQQPTHALSVILVLPFARRQGFGDLLLSVAFNLSEYRAKTCGKEECCGSAAGKIDEPFSELGREAIHRFFANRLLTRGVPAPETRFASGAELIEQCLGVHPIDGFKFLVRLNALHSSGRSDARRYFMEASPEIQSLQARGVRPSIFSEARMLPLSRGMFHYA